MTACPTSTWTYWHRSLCCVCLLSIVLLHASSSAAQQAKPVSRSRSQSTTAAQAQDASASKPALKKSSGKAGKANTGRAAARTAPVTSTESPRVAARPAATRKAVKRTEFEVLDEPEMIIDEPPMTMSNFFHEPTWDGYSIDTTCGVWAEVDYLLWRRKGRDLPALVTTEPNGGVLPSATILYGNGEVGNDVRPGGRLRLGTFLDRTNCWSLEGSFLMLADSDERFFVDSATTSTIARPFFNLTQDLQGAVVGQDALQVAAPGFATGSLLVTSSSDVWLADALLRTPLCQAGPLTLDFLAGYQAARIDEDLLISSNSTLQNTNATVEIVDSFATENQFHGGVLGLELARVFRRWDVQLTGKVAMGNMRQVVDIQGRQVTTVGNAVSVLEGGLLAQPTNIGTYEREVFAVAPEVAVNLRYHLTCHLEVMAGYSFLAFNRVAQPGDQIDFSVNPNQPPPANEAQRPGFVFRDGDYFLHGVHVGAQWSF